MRKRLGVLALAWGVCIASAHAQVEVAEPMIPGAGTVRSAPVQQPSAPPASSMAPAAAGASSSELFYQIQLLQEEVMKLRGMVEEQAQELRQLKQQRLDDYISLDRRLAALGSAGGAPSGAEAEQGGAAALAPPAPSSAAGGESAAGEEQAYQAAYELVRARRFPEATAAFNEFVAQYPRGQYTGNAHYWLGELYLLEGDSAAAKRNFETLLNDFADNRKVPDAMFKLGRIYHQEGDTARARELLQRVVNDYGGTDSSAPRLAREYLQQNF
jgi:tol-pal system protein YbgF